jgi:hypothetical protein
VEQEVPAIEHRRQQAMQEAFECDLELRGWSRRPHGQHCLLQRVDVQLELVSQMRIA